jgi:hypothetical protein
MQGKNAKKFKKVQGPNSGLTQGIDLALGRGGSNTVECHPPVALLPYRFIAVFRTV